MPGQLATLIPRPGGCLDVDRVEAGSGANDQFELTGLQRVCCDASAPDNENVSMQSLLLQREACQRLSRVRRRLQCQPLEATLARGPQFCLLAMLSWLRVLNMSSNKMDDYWTRSTARQPAALPCCCLTDEHFRPQPARSTVILRLAYVEVFDGSEVTLAQGLKQIGLVSDVPPEGGHAAGKPVERVGVRSAGPPEPVYRGYLLREPVLDLDVATIDDFYFVNQVETRGAWRLPPPSSVCGLPPGTTCSECNAADRRGT